MKHIDTETLKRLKEKLLTQQEKLEKMLERVKEGNPANDSARVDDNASPDTDASEEALLIQSEVMDDTLDASLKRVTDALQKIKDGNYGIDKNTGEPIPVARLEIDPTADTCV